MLACSSGLSQLFSSTFICRRDLRHGGIRRGRVCRSSKGFDTDSRQHCLARSVLTAFLNSNRVFPVRKAGLVVHFWTNRVTWRFQIAARLAMAESLQDL